MKEGMGPVPVPFLLLLEEKSMFDNMYNRNAAYGAYTTYPQPTAPTSYAMGMYNRPIAGNQIT